MDQVLCLSSQATKSLLTLRNPQGSEENWIDREEDKGDMLLFSGKVVSAEIACSLLVVTATIETITYAVLGLASLCLWPITSSPAKQCGKLLSSSCFTVIWNIGNVTVFNPFYTNCVTHESFARYSIDNWDRGVTFRLVLGVTWLVLGILSKNGGSSSSIIELTYTRNVDILYIAHWTLQHRAPPIHGVNNLLHRILRYGEGTLGIIEQGATFIRQHILAEGQLDGATRDKIQECDPDALLFMMTRSVYIYTFGELREQPIPRYFSPRTRTTIIELREKYRSDPREINLDRYMEDIVVYDQGPDDDFLASVFNEVKGIAYADQQEGILLTSSLEMACHQGLREQTSFPLT